MECPQCKSDNVQRLSIIYQSGTQNIKTTSRTSGSAIGFGGGGIATGLGSAHTTTKGTAQSLMAGKAAPPAKQSFKIVFALALFAIVMFMISQTMIGILTIGLGAFLAFRAFSYNNNEWPPKYESWQKKWHCNKCGEIYAV